MQMWKMRLVVATSLFCALLFVACTAGPAVEPPVDEEPTEMPEESLSEVDEPTRADEVPPEMDAFMQDAQAYAEANGISLEEALARLEASDQLGDLPTQLEQNEADTFAGMWIEHDPEYRIVFAFTENGEETLAKYVEGKPFEKYVHVVTHRYTYAQLKEAQQQVVSIMEQLGIGGSSGIDVMENTVYVTVGNPDLFREEVQAAGLQLPEAVQVQAIDSENLTDTLHGGVELYEGPQGETIYFPRQAPSGAGMEALMEGTLVLDENGCLRVESGHEEGRPMLVIWPADAGLVVEGDAITVMNAQGEAIGRVGEAIRMGGGAGGSTLDLPDMPHDKCPGPYWIAGDVPTLQVQATPDITVYTFPLEGGRERLGQFLSQSKPAPAADVLSGTLTVEDGCLRVAGYTVIWPPDLYPGQDSDPLTVVAGNALDGEVVATVGSDVELQGAERTEADYRYFESKVNCPGPYWGVASVGATKSE